MTESNTIKSIKCLFMGDDYRAGAFSDGDVLVAVRGEEALLVCYNMHCKCNA
ncbi:hypothetical protein [Adlercreutzia equolifaciens]|uniref:hypothetical protein n=1 Tax=Adlercreutzia equolifaciens TaxID=446660 RepID=UPI0022E975A1|nr:hypothetical protein [Adlercreutzia equolifaciens]